MKIVVVSDNHGKIKPLTDILTRHADADIFIHCGDSELPPEYLQGYVCVKGNNDFYGDYVNSRVLDVEGHRILIIHGHQHLYMGKPDLLVAKAKQQNCDIVCYGHTHVFSDTEVAGVRLINPGSLSRNRDYSRASYAVLTLYPHRIEVQRCEREGKD